MGFSFGNALAAVPDVHTQTCLQRLGATVSAMDGTLSTLTRNNRSTSELIAGNGLTGGGPFNSSTSATLNVGAGTGISVAADSVGLTNTAVTPGAYTYAGFTVDAQGRLTAAASGAAPAAAADPTGTIGITAVNGSASTYMRSDAAPAFDMTIARPWTAGVHTFTAQDVHNGGISLGTSGVLTSNVADGANVTGTLVDAPNLSNAIGTSTRAAFGVKVLDTAGSPAAYYPFQVTGDGAVVFGEIVKGTSTTINSLISVQKPHPTNTNIHGTFQLVTGTAPAGTGMTVGTITTSNFGAWFRSTKNTSATSNVGGAFECGTIAQNSGTTWNDWWSGYFRAFSASGTSGAASSVLTRAGGVIIDTATGSGLPSSNPLTITEFMQLYIKQGRSSTKPLITTLYGAKIDEQTAGTTNYGIWLSNATAAYKAIAIRDTNTWIGSSAAATLDLNGTTAIKVVAPSVVFSDAAVLSNAANATGLKIGAAADKLGLYSVVPVIQPVGALQAAITNSTGGTQDGTLVDVTTAALADPAKINDNFTDIYALLNAMRTAMVAFGSMKGAA